MKVYLVGGAVRNLLLGKSAVDKDYLVMESDRDTFLYHFPEAKEVGKSFPVFLIDGDEYSFPRTPEGDLDSDLNDRDFTINAMALDDNGNLFCHPKALQDIHTRSVRPANAESLNIDPLRCFRAARFLAQYPDFSAHEELRGAMRRCAQSDQLSGLAPLRVWREVHKALSGPLPSRFFQLLAETHCLASWLPELAALRNIPAGPPQHHAHDALNHTMRVVDACAANHPGNALLGWMGLCHDLGKARTPPDRWPSHHKHEELGVMAAKTMSTRLAAPNTYRDAGNIAAKLHMTAGRYPSLRPGTRVDLLTKAHAKRLVHSLFHLVRADKGEDHLPLVQGDLDAILAVQLPEQFRNLGSKSGYKLRELRAQALAAAANR